MDEEREELSSERDYDDARDPLEPTFDQLALYINLIRILKPTISSKEHSSHIGPPQQLRNRIFIFLQAALGIDTPTAEFWWASFRHMAWNTKHSVPADLATIIPVFLDHGLPLGVSCFEVFPPTRKCATALCPHNPAFRAQSRPKGEAPDLGESIRIPATFFTREFGPVPGYTTSLYCRGCLTRFYHNYSVKDDTRTYYPETAAQPQSFIQISTHFFIQGALCERFATNLTTSFVSSQNNARGYNLESQNNPWSSDLPLNWAVRHNMEYEDAMDGFITYSLLNWHAARGSTLQVPHNAPTQAARFHDALQARNIALSGTGQPAWNHACNRCTRHVKDENGNLVAAYRSVVVDGISLGHPCCAVHDCKELLPTNRHRYCATHSSARLECAVEGCREAIVQPFRTCAIPEHRRAEERYKERGKALFQLKERLRKLAVDGSTSSVPPEPPPQDDGTPPQEDEDDEEIMVDEEGVRLEHCDDKPGGGHRKVFARFGRRRTHNEELCVASCGVILARATFYGAEGPNSVITFLKNIFPTRASLPSIIWYDTNCLLAALLERLNDHYFDGVALPVDVFHFKAKHKESHGYCGRNCNPALWPELYDAATDKWVFNSSAAEQSNVWVGGFRGITRVMRQDRYNFLLDEVIMRHNSILIAELEKAGCAPYLIPREDLLRPD